MARRTHRGFTLIEILVTIGIMLVLVGIAVLGFRHFDKVAAENLTRTRLENCKSLLSQYEGQATLYALEGVTPAIYTNATLTCSSPGDVNFGGPNRYSGAVLNTGLVFQNLVHYPEIKSSMGQFAGDSLLQAPPGAPVPGPWLDANNISLPVMLDGWKNPIIYVPSGGMTGVFVGGTPGATSGVVGAYKTVYAIDGRPFWASAGPDGSFSTGDDNLYSSPVGYK